MSTLSRLLGGGREELPLPYPPGSPEGLAARWVRWVAGFGPRQNPVSDTTGALADTDQPGDVWFLAGTSGETIQRRCVVPAGVPLFLPAFAMWHRRAEEPPPRPARAYGGLRVDDATVDPDAIATPTPFDVAGAWMNPITATRKPVPVTVWGLWKYVAPLPRGRHVLLFYGGDGDGFTMMVTYHLSVVG